VNVPPLHQAAPYFTMFPLEYPLTHLRGLPAGSWVLDPFVGRGTTVWASRILGLRVVGVEVSRVGAAQARALLAQARAEEVLGLAEELLQKPAEPPPEGEFWELAYHPETLREILALRRGLLELGEASGVADLLRLFILGRLHGPIRKTVSYFSNQMPRTYAPKPDYAVGFWRRRGLRPPRAPVLDVLQRAVRRYLAGALPPEIEGAVIQADARRLDYAALGKNFRAVVTSPPYPGMRTYVPDQWLRGWFLGGPPRPEYAYKDQLAYTSRERYVAELKSVWLGVAKASVPGAKLVVRLGSLRRDADPLELFADSLQGTPWRLVRVEMVPDRRRQSVQFLQENRQPPVREADFVAVLEG
jgi:hypothetical protein